MRSTIHTHHELLRDSVDPPPPDTSALVTYDIYSLFQTNKSDSGLFGYLVIWLFGYLVWSFTLTKTFLNRTCIHT